jgi:hypothetical protein
MKGILPATSVFQGGEMFILFLIGYSAELKKLMHFLKEIIRVRSRSIHLVHCFPVRTVLIFERNSACQSGFSRGRNAYFVPKSLFN